MGQWLTMLNAIFFGLGAISMIKYKITRKNNAALNEALEKRKAGEEYSVEGFKELLPAWYKKENNIK